MMEAQGERNQLLSVKSKLLEQLADLKENKLSNSQELELGIESFDLKQQVETLTILNKKLRDTSETIKKQNDELKAEVDKLKVLVNEQKNATNVDESMFDDDEVEEFKTQIKTLEKEKETIQESFLSSTEIIENLKQELVNLKKELESEDTEIGLLNEDHAKKIIELENEIEKLKKLQLDSERKTKASSD